MLFLIKKSREIQKRQQKAPVWFYPLYTTSTVCIGYSPEHLFRLCFLPQLSESAVHRQVSLSPVLNTDALPSFSLLPPAPRDADCAPHVSACRLLTSSVSSDPKALWTRYPGTVRRSRVPALAQPCLNAVQGLQAGAGWHPCMELVHGETCSVGLNSAFRYEAQNPTSHHKQHEKKQVKCSNISLMFNEMLLI